MYAADVTRSYPVSGRFSPDQRDDLRDRPRRAEGGDCRGQARASPFHEVYDATVDVVVDGLLKLGILTGDRDEIMKSARLPEVLPPRIEPLARPERPRRRQLRLPAARRAGALRQGADQARARDGRSPSSRALHPRGLDAGPKRWWNIGVRIEDDVLVTPHGLATACRAAPPGRSPTWRRPSPKGARRSSHLAAASHSEAPRASTSGRSSGRRKRSLTCRSAASVKSPR